MARKKNYTLDKEKLIEYFKPEYLFNRELSWLDFNRRVMEEATNDNLPLLDRVKFISIFFSNLDEYYMIRVSGIKEQINAKIIEPTLDGLTPIEELEKIKHTVRPMIENLYSYWNETLCRELRQNDINIVDVAELSESERAALKSYFYKEIYPVLTPLAFDPGRPFPYISNLSISFALIVRNAKGEKHFARVKLPSILPRLIRLDSVINLEDSDCKSKFCAKFIWLDDLVRANLHILFPGLEVIQAHTFRITRDTDIEIQEDEADDLLAVIEENIRQRRFGSVVRLEVERDMPESMMEILSENLMISSDEIHIVDGKPGLSSVMALYGLPYFHLKEPQFHPATPQVFDEGESIFSIIKKRDLLLHHPFDSFNPVIDFIKAAVHDPDVLAIKQTLYRVGSDSPIIKLLVEAAERGKQVAVLVELKARFDEENNIFWAKELEKAGIHVVYGLVGLKTHCKMLMIVRKEYDGVKRYVHLGTGNYNHSTAKLYTDTGLLTADEDICADVSEVFNYLTGYSEQKRFRKLWVAPINLREKFLEYIEREINNVVNGYRSQIIFKMNSLVDPYIIAALYEASQKGVSVFLIVRGICCLVPGVPGLSDNIRVVSIVGRFLEHSRIYYFYNRGKDDLIMSSADLMQRNLDRRVETAFPVENKELKEDILNNILGIYQKDNVKSRVLLPSGKYAFNHRVFDQPATDSQTWLMKRVYSRNQ